MEALFKEIAAKIALAVELLAALLIAYGALEALVKLLAPKPKGERVPLEVILKEVAAVLF